MAREGGEAPLLLLGATGSIGQRLAAKALAARPAGSVTLLVRSRAKLQGLLPAELLDKARVVEADVLDPAALKQAMAGHGHAICTAGNAAQPQQFEAIFKAVVDAAAASLAAPRRLWMLAGATVTDIAGGKPGYTMNDLPIFSLLPFKVHSTNWRYLEEHGASLDWSLMCPGQLHPAASESGSRPSAELYVRAAPLWVPGWQLSACSPGFVLALTLLPQMGKLAVSLEEVAQALLDNLQPSPHLSHQKVGLIKAAARAKAT